MRIFKNTFFIMLILAGLSFAQTKYTWTGGSGSWQTSSNWNPSGVPGIADTAVINSGTLTNDQSVTVAGLFQNGGIINGTGNISITANFIWGSGTHGGTGTTTITSTATGSIGGIYTKTLSRMIVNEGSFVWSGTTVSFNSGAGITNNGIFDAQAGSFVLGSGGNGSIINNGTFNRTTGTGNATIATAFINNGTTNVQSGTLLSTLSTTGSGVFVINPGNKFIISNGNHTLGGNTVSGGGTLELNSGTLNLTGNAVTISSGTTFIQDGGTIAGDGALLINGTYNWLSGTHGGTGTTTITSTATGSIGGIYTKTLSRMIVNEGSFVWSGTTVVFNIGAGITNNGTFDAQAETFVLGSGGNGSIINNGIFNRTTGTGSATISTAFINNGTTNVQSGTLLSTLSTTGSGAFVINPGNKFIISNGNHTLGGNTISGGGTFELLSGTMNLTGSPVNILSGTTFLQNGGTIAGDGALLINGTYNWLSGTHGGTGTTTISSTGTGSIGGIYTKTLSRMIVNEGSFVWSGTTVIFNIGAGITNNGTFDAQAESFVLGSGGNGSIINNGTFNRTSGTGSATISTAFINNGTTNVQSGTLLSTLSTTGSGAFIINPGNKFIISNGNHTLGGNTISGGGTFELLSGTMNLIGSPVNISSGTTFLQNGGTIAGDGALLINGTYNWVSGTHGGTGTTTISSTATGSIGGIYTKTLSRMIVNEGSFVWSGTTVVFNIGAGITNNGTFDAQAETFVLGSGGNGSIINNGTFNRTTGTGNAQIATKFINSDELNILTGTLTFTDSLYNITDGIIKGVGTLTTPTGNRFINNGNVAPGVSPGILSINGNYPQTTLADLNIEIGGYQVGSERDSLFISGQAQLDGTLNIQFIDNFLPSVGDVFTIMRYTSRAGQFSQINFSNNVAGQIQYLSNGAQVLITSGGVNQSPIAVDDAAQTNEDVALVINVLANDSDPDNDPLSINGFTQPVHGSAVQSGDSSISYTPALNYYGLDSLTYTIQDPNGATATAKVRIIVLPVNDPPAVPVLLLPLNGDTLNSNQTINFVWNASSDPENNPLSYALRIWGNSLDTTIAGLNDTTLAFNNPNAFQQNNSYQWQITASDGNLSTPSAIRNFYIASTAMAGVYTIGSGGDFNTINEAVLALKNLGAGGAVTFDILNGVYDEQVVIDSIEGLSSTNLLVIQSNSGNPEDVIWKYSGQAPNSNYVLLLRSISHTTIRGISFIAAKPSAGRLVGLGANASNIVIEDNKFIGVSTTSTTNVYAVINAHNAAIDNIKIVGNKINFGSFAVYLYGFVSQQVSNVTIENNECLGQSFVSIWIINASVIQINNNIIDNGVQLGGGIILNDSYLPISIIGNKITTNKWGISLNFNTAGIGEFLVANNFLEVNAPKNNNYPPFAIRSGSNAGISFLYNTLLVVGDTVENSFALRIEFPTSVKEIKNNILMNTARGRALYYQGTIGIESDFNDLFSEGNTLVTWNSSNYSDLTSYQAARGQDLNSLNVNPSFLSNGDPHLNDFILNNAGTPLAEVTIDIDGEPRHQTTPDIGADEFEPLGFKGIFSIGDGGDFPTITSAVEVLSDTIIAGPVTFNILSGIYNEQVSIDSVNRIYFGSPIIFQSQSGNPEDVIWGYSVQSGSSNYVVLLQNVSHLTFRNLSFKALNQSAGRLIGLGINTSNITIENNICTGINTTSISTGYAIINSSDVALDSISIRNNILEFGSFAIRLYCNSVTGSAVVVQNNDCVSQSAHSILLDNITDVKILKNRIDKSNGSGYAVGLIALQPPIMVIENKILSKNYGLAFSSSNSTGERGLIANNFILVTVESSAIAPYGLRLNSTSDMKVDVYYNTIRIVGAPLQNFTGIYVGIGNTSSQYLKNNIIINEADGFVINNLSPGTISNYNNLYTTGATLVKWNNVNYPDLSSYQTATSQDLNSISADPLFVADDDLHIKPGSPVDGKGTPLTEVPRDIDNQLRSLTAPDIGADEYTSQRIIIKRKNKLNKTILPLTITRDSLHIDPTDDPMLSGYVLSDVNVLIDTLFHSNLADLEISLTHNGEIDTLAKFLPDSSAGLVGTILDDSGLLALTEGVSPYTGSYRPHSPLSVFNGVDPEGEWVLEIYDRSSGNFGILDAWGIELVFEQTTGVPDEQEESIIPDNFELTQNYPNPFNPSTTIQYSVPSRSSVVLKIYDILGGEVSTLVNEEKDSGVYSVSFDASQFASGIYFYKLQAGTFVDTKKMILLK